MKNGAAVPDACPVVFVRISHYLPPHRRYLPPHRRSSNSSLVTLH